MNTQGNKVGALFDIDGTFYRDSLLIEHFKRLIKYEIISPSVWHEQVKHTFNNWDKRQGNYDAYVLDVSENYRKHLIGIHEEKVNFTADQVINLKADRVYKYTRRRIQWHLEQGHKVIFISGSPDFLVSRMAKKYGVTDYKGTVYHTDEKGLFSGELTPMWDSQSKKEMIYKMVDKHNLDLSVSYAYGDTNGDSSMLDLVGNPIAINPAKELLNHIYDSNSLKDRVKIVIERKDVIYHINASNNTIEFI